MKKGLLPVATGSSTYFLMIRVKYLPVTGPHALNSLRGLDIAFDMISRICLVATEMQI